jgi:alkyl hydroperoxide reductase subunit AhpC
MVETCWMAPLGEQIGRNVDTWTREIALRIANGEVAPAEIEAQLKAWEDMAVWHARVGNFHTSDVLEMLADALRQHRQDVTIDTLGEVATQVSTRTAREARRIARRIAAGQATSEEIDLLATSWEMRSEWHEARGHYEKAEILCRIAAEIREYA